MITNQISEKLEIYRGSKVYTQSDLELEELSNMEPIRNGLYIKTLKKIPEYFGTNNFYFCMQLAFLYGQAKGRKLESESIKDNALATFQWIKLYHQKNGCFPDTQKDLWDWQKRFVEELERTEGAL